MRSAPRSCPGPTRIFNCPTGHRQHERVRRAQHSSAPRPEAQAAAASRSGRTSAIQSSFACSRRTPNIAVARRNAACGRSASRSTTSLSRAAVVGIVVTDDFEVFFDTADTSRKVDNLRRNPRIALVIGGTTAGDERTVQYEGVADEPTGAELRRLKELYFESFPDGRERQAWPGITYIRTRPRWIRYTDFNQDPPETVEFDRLALGGSD